jgi:hypothetical protein
MVVAATVDEGRAAAGLEEAMAVVLAPPSTPTVTATRLDPLPISPPYRTARPATSRPAVTASTAAAPCTPLGCPSPISCRPSAPLPSPCSPAVSAAKLDPWPLPTPRSAVLPAPSHPAVAFPATAAPWFPVGQSTASPCRPPAPHPPHPSSAAVGVKLASLATSHPHPLALPPAFRPAASAPSAVAPMPCRCPSMRPTTSPSPFVAASTILGSGGANGNTVHLPTRYRTRRVRVCAHRCVRAPSVSHLLLTRRTPTRRSAHLPPWPWCRRDQFVPAAATPNILYKPSLSHPMPHASPATHLP